MSAEPPEADLRAADGRVPGRRGIATRERLLEHTSRLLGTTAYRDLKVVDIAREAGTSPATFYQYFPDAEAALLALADRLVGEGSERLTLPLRDTDWADGSPYATCQALVDAFLSFWQDHRALIAVIDMAALEGDERFRACRTELLSKVTVAASEAIGNQQQEHGVSDGPDPWAMASVLVAMLAHVSAHQSGIRDAGVSDDQLRDAMTRLLYSGLTGHVPG